MQTLQCLCGTRGLTLATQGNYIFEEILNSVSHGVALIFAIIGAIILMTEVTDAHTEYHFYGCLVFSFTLIFLFAVSTLYHSFFMLPTGPSPFPPLLSLSASSPSSAPVSVF
jgi:predicted membrane channel-forming protein YqfA (hemolysin III family)